MKSRTTKQFRKALKKLPKHVRRLARQSFRIFLSNPAHPGLRFKQICSDPQIWSVRIGIGHRAVAIRDGDYLVWYWIGSHADYDHLCDGL